MIARVLVSLAVVLAFAPGATALTIPKNWSNAETLTHSDLNGNFDAIQAWADTFDSDENFIPDLLDFSRYRWASHYLPSTSCGINQAIASLGSVPDGGTIIAPSEDECENVSAQILMERDGLRIVGMGMGEANRSNSGTRLVWTGSADTALFKLKGCHGCELSNLSMFGADTSGAIGIHFEADNANSDTNTHPSLRNLSIRKFADGIRILGVDTTNYNDQTSELVISNVEVADNDRCYYINGRQVVGLTVVGGECRFRSGGANSAGFYVERGWANIVGTTINSRRWGTCSITTSQRCDEGGNYPCPGGESCTSIVAPGPAIYKGANAGSVSWTEGYSELSGPGIVTPASSTNVRPINLDGTRLNMRHDPDTGDPAVNYALLDIDQVGPVVLSGVTFEAPDANEYADIDLHDTPVEISGTSMVGASNAIDESKFRWVSGDPRGERICETLIAPNTEITAAHDVPSIWVADWRTKITEIGPCESDGTVVLNLQRDDGTPADIATSDLSCTSTPSSASSLSATESILALGDRLDLDLASVSGNPTRLSICYRKDRRP